MEKFKMAIVANSCWNIYNFRMELIRHFVELGHTVIVLAPEDSYYSKLEFPTGVHFQKLIWLEPKGRNPVKDLFCLIELHNAFRKLRPDIVLNYTIKPNIYGSLAARWLGINAVSNLTGLGFTAGKPTLFRNWILQGYKWALQNNQEIIFHNEEDLNWFRERRFISKNRGIVIYGSGVNAEHFKPEEKKKAPDPFVFIFVGRTRKEKGILEFLAAGKILAENYPQMQCWIIGSFEHQSTNDDTHAIVNDFRSKKPFIFFGFEQDVRNRLKAAHVFVLPSYREGRSKAMLEAMAMELPVITTAVAGCQQTITHGVHGLVVEPQNSMALAEAMEKMMKLSEAEISEMGMRCRKRILEQFESKHIFAAYDEVMGRVLNKSN